jgi:hypothetical protein
MRRHLRIPLAAGLVLLAAAPAASAAGAPVATSVSRSAVIGVGVSPFTVSCPKGSGALAGAVVSSPGAALATQSSPGPSGGQWSFVFSSPAPATVRTVVRCVKLDVPGGVRGVSLRIVTVSGPLVDLAPGESQSVRLNCPSGASPTGAGESLSQPAGARASQTGDRAGLDFYRSVPVRGAWEFGLRNQGNVDKEAQPVLRCVTRESVGRRGRTKFRHRFRILRTKFDQGLAPGSRTVAHRCPSGFFSLGTGFAFDQNESLTLESTQPTGKRGARWRFRNFGSADVRAQTFPLCLDRGTEFSRVRAGR